MKRISLSDAKANFGRCVREVKRGESIVILERQRPVAKLTKIDLDEQSDDDVLRALETEGVVRLPTRKLRKDYFKKRKPTATKASVVDALLADRREGDR